MSPSLTLLLFLSVVATVGADDVRQVLHEPLFPIEWTPSPSSDFSSDPPTPATATLVDNSSPRLLPAPLPNTIAADVLSSRSRPDPQASCGGSGGMPKAAIVVASVAVAAVLALLAIVVAFLLTSRLARHPAAARPRAC
uniref:Formin-like protein n=1 Tax=Oryza sativa subsp. japonica TaxID=39947 RepID=Q8LGX2_ORYSJ|nr:formin-like protein [Oryza sativa Japonica Group]BAD30620.1 formin-like protein [Oryza sativa Japonica Group]